MTTDFLSGTKVDTSMVFIPQIDKRKLRRRDQALVDLTKDKSTVHVGFLDHVEVRLEKDAQGDWLHHKLLPPHSKELFGIDIQVDQIEKLKASGWENLHTWATAPVNRRFDVCLVPDVIEHVRNVGDFLEEIKKLDSELFVFTTPNAYSLLNRKILRKECINSDHLQLFSPWTIEAQLFRAGFRVINLELCDGTTPLKPFTGLVKKLLPLARETMVVTAKLIY